MASQGNNPNKENQKSGQQSGKQNELDGKRQDKNKDDQAVGNSASQTGNKSEGGKFDSGNQTNR